MRRTTAQGECAADLLDILASVHRCLELVHADEWEPDILGSYAERISLLASRLAGKAPR